MPPSRSRRPRSRQTRRSRPRSDESPAVDDGRIKATALREAQQAPEGILALGQLFRYVGLVTDLRFEEFRAKLEAAVPEAKEITMTMAEQLRGEGRAEGQIAGRIEGRMEGRMETLRKLLTLKYGVLGADHDARITAAASDQLDRYLERVLTSETIAAVFAE